MRIEIPTGWEDVTVNQFQALRQLNREDFKSDFSYVRNVLEILTDIEDVKFLNLESVSQILPHIEFINTQPSYKRIDSFEYRGERYEWIGDFSSITVGEALSIEQIIDLEDLNYTQAFDVVLAVLLRKEGEEFNAETFNKNRALYGSFPISKVIGMLFFFLNGGKNFIPNLRDYLIVKSTSGKTIQRKSGKWSRLLHWLKKETRFINGYLWLTNLVRETLRMMKQHIRRIT